MLRLTSLLYAVIGTTLAGIFVVAVLTMNRYDVQSIVVAAAVGAILGLPVSWVVARKVQNL